MINERRTADILLVDRHPVTRLGLTSLLDGQDDMQVVGEAVDAADALQKVRMHRPDLVVLEISVKNSNGMELIQQICCPPEQTPVLVVSLYDERVYAPRSLQAGASGFVSKDEPPATIVEAIRSVLSADDAAKSGDEPPMPAADAKGDDIRSLLVKLTERELEVFELLGHGLTVQQIANRLEVTANTVESHRERIKKKLLIASGAELTVRAAQWVVET